MKVCHLNYSDQIGGASIATRRIHQAQLNNGINSKLIVHKRIVNDPNTLLLRDYPSTLIRDLLYRVEDKLLKTMINAKDQLSLSILPPLSKTLSNLETDIINLHWVNGGMLSIKDISRIKKPKVWTLHDMWAFSSIEHYPLSSNWKINSPDYPILEFFNIESWIKRYVFERKKLCWREPFPIVAPSEWMKKQVTQSKIMKNWPIYVINNPIDIEEWQNEPMLLARTKLNLPLKKKLILFGASGGIKDGRKGFSDLLKSIKNIESKVELVLFGREYDFDRSQNIKIHQMGYINDTGILNSIYAACDALAIPSKADNFPNTILESMASGTPVIGYKVGGIPELINHKDNGYLAKKNDYKDFAHGINWVFSHNKYGRIGINAREWIKQNFSYNACATKYTDLYEELLR